MPRRISPQGRLFEKKLFYGDNLRVLRMPEHFPDASIDLVYLDPPFKPNEQYNVLFRDQGASVPSASQVRAFEDTWRWGTAARDAFNDVRENAPPHVRGTMEALLRILGYSNMFAYLAMMAPRLVELHRVLKPTGSIYLHCDPAASRYLGVLMDSVFGAEHFVNEIVWKRTSAHNRLVRYGPIHDVILFYAKSDQWDWQEQYTPYDEDYVRTFYRHIEKGTGRRYRLDNVTSNRPGGRYLWNGQPPPGRRYWGYSEETMRRFEAEGRLVYSAKGYPQYKRYLDEMPGVPLQDVWTDIPPLGARSAERLGYPTQKPVALLDRIISASSKAGDVVLDPFCGCGTTIEAAEALGRHWLGIDITYDAIPIIRGRLAAKGLADGTDYEVWGSPETVEDAAQLAREHKYQFQWWAVRRLGAKEVLYKKGPDQGVDGRLTLVSNSPDRFPEAVISVKAGQTGPAHVRELAGTMRAQNADIGVLVVVKPPTKGMRDAAEAEGGYPAADGSWCPRLQVLTAADVMAGVGVKAPSALALEGAAAAPATRSRRRARS